jgi:dihydroxyacid dehydratase/phosphogluconate dehydratase
MFLSEPAAIAAIKEKCIQAGHVLVLAYRGPMGAGMEEPSQLTSAPRHCFW